MVQFMHTDPKRKSYNMGIFYFNHEDVVVNKPASFASKKLCKNSVLALV